MTGPSEWLGVTVSRGEPMIGRFGTSIIQVFIITVIFAGSSSNFLIQTVCNCFFLLFGFNTIIQCVNVIIIHSDHARGPLSRNEHRGREHEEWAMTGLCCHDPSCWLAKKHNHWPRGPQLEYSIILGRFHNRYFTTNKLWTQSRIVGRPSRPLTTPFFPFSIAP